MKCSIIILLLFLNPETQFDQQVLTVQQDSIIKKSAWTKENRSKLQDIIQKVEQGIKTGDIGKYEKYIANLISVTIGSSEHGYYSSGQAVSILADYFSARRPISFRFSKILETGQFPYATGRFVYFQKGIQESAQIYISLTLQDSLWVINQFNIY